MTVPLKWTIDINSIRREGAYSYSANAAELEALGQHADVEDLMNFRADVEVLPLSGGKFRVNGKLTADLVQSSVVDLKAVPAEIEESFSVEYWPCELIGEEVAMRVSPDQDPPEALIDGRIPIGELLSELLLVSIDPYPRNEGDSFDWSTSESDPGSGAFAALAQFRRQKQTDAG